MLRTNRLAVARWAAQVLSPQVKAHGLHHPATSLAPAHWTWQVADVDLSHAEQVLPHPESTALENVVDVWAGPGNHKVLSVSWSPATPWIPPVVRSFKGGDWLQVLGYDPQRDSDQRTV
jgi:hypothetical protein